MTRTFLMTTLAVILPMALAAQDAEDGSAGPIDSRDGTFLMSAEDFDVLNADGEKIGEIEEFLIDNNGEPVGVMIDMGGFLGLGDQDVSVPLNALAWNGRTYVTKMTQTQLENLQPFDE